MKHLYFRMPRQSHHDDWRVIGMLTMVLVGLVLAIWAGLALPVSQSPGANPLGSWPLPTGPW